ncbi:hypothetical protein CAOG_05489 [Capsaspora owczarzaki ATCC 30864]|uniref:Uncharacterized protein n=1 Tax=Capsaspora owczarzaki (strain ATCC 30864) TaxID=595528 RepID=A0A0D2WS75_CAPO3|nr:hypothetical protein CAOG_05489 [Capsaspora owczarzaki ATCC 30864]KJE94950.1 hypothetical protein CAOG_005489 [Capsaspora owczarzaki ATCC 30864]|eukprot:XP_004346162.1 hypothetical protein CAOG_05489 [Capsaspora owczarzaki ATCC 30864]
MLDVTSSLRHRLPVSMAMVRQLCGELQAALGLQPRRVALGVHFVGETRMKALVAQAQSHELASAQPPPRSARPTDILAFGNPMDVAADGLHKHPASSLEEMKKCNLAWKSAYGDPVRDIGELFLCPAVIERDCLKDQVTFEGRLPVLLAHGLCHLLGHDHDTMRTSAQMFQLEQQLLQAVSPHTGKLLQPLARYTNESDQLAKH